MRPRTNKEKGNRKYVEMGNKLNKYINYNKKIIQKIDKQEK